MRTIFKYDLPIPLPMNQAAVEIHVAGARVSRILDVGEQMGRLRLWVEVHTGADSDQISAHVVGTGAEVPLPATQYIGTVDIDGFIWHVYAKKMGT